MRIFGASLALWAVTATAQAQTLQLDGGGVVSITGIVPQAMATHTPKEGISLQVITGQTLTRSLMRVAAGQLDSSVVPTPAFRAMQEGVGPYESHGDQARQLAGNVRALSGLPGSTFHAIAWADSGIESWEDLRGKSVYIGPPAGIASLQITGMIEAASGLVEGEDYEGERAPWGIATQSFQDGHYDVLVISAPVGQQSLNELSLQRPIRILGIPEAVVDTPAWDAYTERAGMTYSTIPARTYEGQVNADEDLLTASNVMFLAVHKDMNEDVAYRYTKAYRENIDAMKGSNALLRAAETKDPFLGVNAPLHPGAVRYYRERDVEIPESLLAE
ncbi:TAXI family TRAP transporter solute-binding subunit [Halomonas sp. DX6]|uniref:TAXI family TRAP transporter solute-binding subunit n=2 Tax=Billgrantia bachuensis TaxID=2717286 RepID=A0ABX0PYI6_9GAMM|nr:TAXI family TRAP transporter solute-binding subunit [Halomonas bachuensis]